MTVFRNICIWRGIASGVQMLGVVIQNQTSCTYTQCSHYNNIGFYPTWVQGYQIMDLATVHIVSCPHLTPYTAGETTWLLLKFFGQQILVRPWCNPSVHRYFINRSGNKLCSGYVNTGYLCSAILFIENVTEKQYEEKVPTRWSHVRVHFKYILYILHQSLRGRFKTSIS